MKRFKDSEFTPYKILGFSAMICAIFMFLLALLIDFPGKGQILQYTYHVAKPRDVAIALYSVGAPLFLMGAVTVLFRIAKKAMAYIIIAIKA